MKNNEGLSPGRPNFRNQLNGLLQSVRRSDALQTARRTGGARLGRLNRGLNSGLLSGRANTRLLIKQLNGIANVASPRGQRQQRQVTTTQKAPQRLAHVS